MKLKEVVDFQNGYAFKSKDFISHGKYQIIKIKELKDGEVRFFTDSASVNVNEDEYRNYLIHNGDILFALTGDPVNKPNPLSWVGRVSIYNHEQKSLLNQRVCKVVPSDKVNVKYLYYYFRDYTHFYALASIAKGSASQANISSKDIGEMEIELPSLETQNKVVEILDSISERISNNRNINKNLEQQAMAIFNDMFAESIYGESSVGDYIVPNRGKGLLSKDAIAGDVPVVAGGLEPATYHNQANTYAPVLTISASGANAGFVNLWNIPVWSSDSSFIDSTMTEDVYFWYVMFKSRQSEIFDAQTGSAQPHIYPKHIAGLPIGNININDIKQYTTLVSPLFETIGTNKKENSNLSFIRDALLPKLMTGELDVSDIDI
ncbi:MAG: restriction endonuclease subunit S [Solobacterium sp.]|jgi:type I restriction enzyme S subunit|nr:restriction endonuclease subunit S [Solobacterium sp.]